MLSKLGSFATAHAAAANEAISGIFDPYVEVQQELVKRAIERGELSPPANTKLASQAIVSMINYRSTVEMKSIDRAYRANLLDQMILPALEAPSPLRPSKKH